MIGDSWKSLKGVVECGDNYEITPSGKVKNVNSQRELKQHIGRGGYYRLSLFHEGKLKKYYLHRLLAYAFLPKVDGKDFINHIDGDKLNNDLSNLEWCTQTENVRHAFDTGLNKADCSHLRKPVIEFSMDDGRLLAEYPSTHEASRQTGIDQSTISQQCRKLLYSRRESYFRFAEERQFQKRAT